MLANNINYVDVSMYKRIWIFIKDRFPLEKHIPVFVFIFLAHYWGFQALSHSENLQISWNGIAGCVTLILLAFLMRVYDEIKDIDTDIRLGKSGDPRFKDRPIVTGAIVKEDLFALRWILSLSVILLNLLFIGSATFYTFCFVFVFMWFSFKWFFWPAIQTNIVLAFITHNPVVALYGLYVLMLSIGDSVNTNLQLSHFVLLVGLWLPLALWEIARKIRIPEDETDYQTYSKVLGWRLATFFVLLMCLGSYFCVFYAAHQIGLPVWFYIVMSGVGSAFTVQCLWLLIKPSSRTANLLPLAETYTAVVSIGFVVALGLHTNGILFR